jgi:hypothetical protein
LHVTCCSCDSSPVSIWTRCEAMSCSVCQYLYFCTSKASKLSTATGCAIRRPCRARAVAAGGDWCSVGSVAPSLFSCPIASCWSRSFCACKKISHMRCS